MGSHGNEPTADAPEVDIEALTEECHGMQQTAARHKQLSSEIAGLEATAEDIISTVHAHPTMAESIHEAALATEGRMIHN